MILPLNFLECSFLLYCKSAADVEVAKEGFSAMCIDNNLEVREQYD